MNYEEAIEACQDDVWSRRAEAAEVLAQFTDDLAYTMTIWLLADCQDTAVVLRAAEALVQRADLYGASLAFSGYALANEQAGYHIGWAIHTGWYESRFDIESFRELILATDNPTARQGIKRYLEWHDIFDSKDQVILDWYRGNRV